MRAKHGSQAIEEWPEESREAARLVIDQYGEPDETAETRLTWHRPGPWKRIVASKAFYQHNFPAPHIDSVESIIDYRVPVDKFTQLAEFDGSVIVERTAGEVSARCHDEQANFLALNLMHDIVTGARACRRRGIITRRSLRISDAKSPRHTWKNCTSLPETAVRRIPTSGSCRTRISRPPPRRASSATRPKKPTPGASLAWKPFRTTIGPGPAPMKLRQSRTRGVGEHEAVAVAAGERARQHL
jgi:hypothetical protein